MHVVVIIIVIMYVLQIVRTVHKDQNWVLVVVVSCRTKCLYVCLMSARQSVVTMTLFYSMVLVLCLYCDASTVAILEQCF